MHNLGEIYKKLHHGDPISDSELKYGIKMFRFLEEKLRELGPNFYLATKEIRWDLSSMEGFERARRER